MRTRLMILLFCLLATSAWGSDLKGSCQIEFFGTSTLHDFSGQASCQPFVFAVSEDAQVGLRFKGQEISVAVFGMDTDNKKRDKKMREMFEVEKFPLIQGSLGLITPQMIREFAAGRTDKKGQLPFDLKIRDINNPQTARVSNLQEDDKQLSFDLGLDLSLKTYQIKPPSVLGLIRVGDQVGLKIHVLLNKQEPGLKLLPL